MAKDEAKWAYWTKHIKAWQASGHSRHAYCQREGLKPTTFDYWRPLIASDHAEVNAVKQPVSGNDITLVPVALAPGHPVGHPVGQPPAVKTSGHAVDFARDVPREFIKVKSPSGWEMQLPVSVDPNWLMALGQLLAVLRQLP